MVARETLQALVFAPSGERRASIAALSRRSGERLGAMVVEACWLLTVFTGHHPRARPHRGLDGDDDGVRLTVEAAGTAAQAATGDSVSIDGVCLTAVDRRRRPHRLRRRARDARPHDARRGSRAGDNVNVEPALRAGEPLGGHYVQGHVDAVGRVRSVEPEGDGRARLDRRARGRARLLRREGLGDGRRRLAHRGRARRRRLRGRARPAHARGDDARRRSSRATRSTSRRTCSPSTSSASSVGDTRGRYDHPA